MEADHELVKELISDIYHSGYQGQARCRGILTSLAREVGLLPEVSKMVQSFGDRALYPDRPMVTLFDEGPSIYLLGWRQGDFTDIHDHGSCEVGVFVVQGTITEELFVCGSNGAGTSRRPCALHWAREVSAGGMINCPQEYIHSIGNLFPEIAATLHCYGPALDDMSLFEMRDGMVCFKEHWHDAKSPQH